MIHLIHYNGMRLHLISLGGWYSICLLNLGWANMFAILNGLCPISLSI